MEDAGVLKEQRKGKARSSRRGLIGLVVVKMPETGKQGKRDGSSSRYAISLPPTCNRGLWYHAVT